MANPPQGSSILMLRSVFAEILHSLTAAEPQLFSDMYSRLVFIADRYELPDYIRREAHAFRRIATKAQRKQRTNIDLATLHGAARALALVVFYFSEVRAEEPLRTVLLQAKPLAREAARVRAQTLPLLRCTIQELFPVENKHGRAIQPVQGLSHEGETLVLRLSDPWHETGQLVWAGATLHCTQMRHVETNFTDNDDGTRSETSIYETSNDSVVVLEPDYLMDVTEIAECVQRPLPHGGNPRLSLLKKFLPTEAKMSLVGGNVANYAFDALLSDKNAHFDTVFQTAILQRPLQIVALEEEHPDALARLRLQASMIFSNIKTLLGNLNWDKASIEASFMAPLYGVQGRLDLMLEYDDDARRKTVIELKSGSPPVNGTWENNAAQVTCYNLLLDACFRERSGDSSIFYAQDLTRPLRNVINDARSKQFVLALRNRIIAQEHAVLSRQFKPLRELHPEHIGLLPPFLSETVRHFAFAFAGASSLERKYFQVFTAFVMRENWSTRLGGERSRGFAALWRTSLTEKADNYAVLSHLELDTETSDFAQFHLHFRRSEQTSALANFRVGDIVIAYPMAESVEDGEEQKEEQDERTFLRASLAKGYIKSLTKERVVVSLRNKLLGENLFSGERLWAIEPDFMGTEFKSQYESLYEFLRADDAKRSLLLGLREPEFTEEANISYPDLTDEQNERLRRAMSAKDYFLLQGPPGTGKTSRMLKSMARHLFENTDEHVLLLAFTNRAVDEMCEALKYAKKDTPTLDFIRLGAKESTKHTDRVLYAQMEGKSIEEIRALLKGTRIIVSTISSLLKTPELLAIKTFGTVIIDEASQVVEPQLCGLLTKFPRCILIGDEKQLPAVVVQPERGTFTSDAELNAVGIVDLRTSLFERLLTRCIQQGWHKGYGIISQQGRMHQALMRFPNEQFYNSVLTPLAAWQREEQAFMPLGEEFERGSLQSSEILASETAWENVRERIGEKRLVFWSSEVEKQTKVHEQEAVRAAGLAAYFREQLGESFHAGSIGIITPFRAQIAAIHRHLPEELRTMVSVDTVERYQGSERDVIILSFAVNYPSQLASVQSLSADGTIDRKLNVALTRARQQLVVLGCEEVLAKQKIFAKFLDFVRSADGFVEHPSV